MNKIFLSTILLIFLIGIISASPLTDLMSKEATNLSVRMDENNTFIDFYLNTSGYSWDEQTFDYQGYSFTIPVSWLLDGINFREDFNKTLDKVIFSDVHIGTSVSFILDYAFGLADLGFTCNDINNNNSILTNLANNYIGDIEEDSYLIKNGNNYQVWINRGWGDIQSGTELYLELFDAQGNPIEIPSWFFNSDYMEQIITNINKSIEQGIYLLNPKLLVEDYIIYYAGMNFDEFMQELNYSVEEIKRNYVIEIDNNIEIKNGNYEVNVTLRNKLDSSETFTKTVYLTLEGFPECIENLAYTEWSSWANIETCQSNNFLTQSRFRVKYDENSCGFENVTEYEYQETICDYCTPNLINSSWSDWIDTEVCQSNNFLTQSRFRVKYDENNCNEISNQTFYEFQESSCDFCSPNLVYSDWTDWENTSVCQENNSLTQSRSRVLFDNNYCNEVSNQTFTENKETSCVYTVLKQNYTETNTTIKEWVGMIGEIENGSIVNISFLSQTPANLTNVNQLKIINITLNKNSSGWIYFNVNKPLVVNKSKINLYVWENAWTKLNIIFLNDTGTKYEYKSYTPHFSVFMIGEELIVSSDSGSGGSSGGSSSDDDDGHYIPKPKNYSVCDVGEIECSANGYLYECKGGEWKLKDACANGCSKGMCNLVDASDNSDKQVPVKKGLIQFINRNWKEILPLMLIGIIVVSIFVLVILGERKKEESFEEDARTEEKSEEEETEEEEEKEKSKKVKFKKKKS